MPSQRSLISYDKKLHDLVRSVATGTVHRAPLSPAEAQAARAEFYNFRAALRALTNMADQVVCDYDTTRGVLTFSRRASVFINRLVPDNNPEASS